MAGFDVAFRRETAFADTADAWTTRSTSCTDSPARDTTRNAVADDWSAPVLAGDPYRESEVIRSVDFGSNFYDYSGTVGGSPYRESEVTRSVEFGGNFYDYSGLVGGSPYSESEVTRSVEFGGNFYDYSGLVGGDFLSASDSYALCDASRSTIPFRQEADLGSLPGDWHDGFSKMMKGGDNLEFGESKVGITSSEKINNLEGAEFPQGTVAPELPNDEYFRLLPTATYIVSSEICHVGNALVRFLSEEFSCSDFKVKTDRCTIQAHVARKADPYLADAGECTVKLRIYSLGYGNHAIELQRRRGDIVFFRDVFKMLTRCLDQNLFIEQ